MSDGERHLSREITWLQGTAMTIGAVIGAGILVLPALAAEEAGPASLVSWALMGLFALPMLAAIAQMSSRFPNSGGVAAYAQQAFGPGMGRLAGFLIFTAVPIGVPPVALIGASYFNSLFGWGSDAAYITAAAMALLAAALNYRGVELSGADAALRRRRDRRRAAFRYVFFARRGARGEFRAFRAARRGGRGSRDVSAFLRLSRLGDDRSSRRGVQGPAARHTAQPRRGFRRRLRRLSRARLCDSRQRRLQGRREHGDDFSHPAALGRRRGICGRAARLRDLLLPLCTPTRLGFRAFSTRRRARGFSRSVSARCTPSIRRRTPR